MRKARIGVIIHQPLCETLFSPEDRARLESLGDVVWTEATAPLSVAQASVLLGDCEIGVGSWGTPYPCAELLDACPRLRLWEHAAGTVKHMFGDHLLGRDLKIASCKTAIADLVAEMTLGEILLGLRRVFENATANRAGIAPKPHHLKTLTGSTVGVVGASEVGRRVIRLLRAFPCKILLYDPFVSAQEAIGLGTEKRESLIDLCQESDVVTLHVPDLPATRHMMNAEAFGAMQEGAVFINTARGASVDETALIAQLEQGRLFAFLDVSAPEPAAPHSPLRHLPNVVYTSHIAGPASTHIGSQAASDIAAYLRGASPLYVATAETLERTA